MCFPRFYLPLILILCTRILRYKARGLEIARVATCTIENAWNEGGARCILIRVTWISSGCVFAGDESVPDRYAAGWQYVQPVLRAQPDNAGDNGPGGPNGRRQSARRGTADSGDAAEDATY